MKSKEPGRVTPRQRQTLKYIARYSQKNGYPPTLREVATQLGIQPSAARDKLLALERKGYVQVTPNISRGLRVLRAL